MFQIMPNLQRVSYSADFDKVAAALLAFGDVDLEYLREHF